MPALRNCAEVCMQWNVIAREFIDLLLPALQSHHPRFLNEEQAAVYDAATYVRRDVFFTGRAGVGKSFLGRAIIGRFEEMGVRVSVCPPTRAPPPAQNLGGTTLHEFMGRSRKQAVWRHADCRMRLFFVDNCAGAPRRRSSASRRTSGRRSLATRSTLATIASST